MGLMDVTDSVREPWGESGRGDVLFCWCAGPSHGRSWDW